VSESASASRSANGIRAASAGSISGLSGLSRRTNKAPIQYGNNAPSAGRPPTVGASHEVLPWAMLTM
jgi:hypothetical protein